MPREVELWTDGACSGTPGPGGWAALLRTPTKELVVTGSHPETTNQRMELTAVIEGLDRLHTHCRVTVYTDSHYVAKAFTDGWIDNWNLNGWRNSKRQPVANRDLWERLIKIVAKHRVVWITVKGHTDVALNNRVDALACAAKNKIRIASIR